MKMDFTKYKVLRVISVLLVLNKWVYIVWKRLVSVLSLRNVISLSGYGHGGTESHKY